MRGELFFESGSPASLSLPQRGSFSVRNENGYEAYDGTASDGTRYVTLTGYDAEDAEALSAFVSQELGSFLERVGVRAVRSVLVAGIGNGRIEADSLGPLVSERISAGGAGNGAAVFSFAAGVPEATGIGTEAIVPAVARLVGADLIIAVDSLAALAPERLCRAVQISDGARPGSGVEKTADAIGEDPPGRAVVTVGVPTAVRGRLSRGEGSADGLFTVCGVGASVVIHAEAIAGAVNSYFG